MTIFFFLVPRLVYRTGDFAKICDGLIYYEGRSDGQIKIRGHRVDINEVQLTVQKLPEVSTCAVLCYRPGTLQQVCRLVCK